MTRSQVIIAELLHRFGPQFGAELVERSGGYISRGKVYVDLMEMEDRGEVTSVEVPDGRSTIPRLEFRITSSGTRELFAAPDRRHALVGIVPLPGHA